MKKVLVIAHIFPPLGGSGVQRTLKFIKYLREYNYEPIVVTVGESDFLFKDKSLLKQIPEGIQIIRVDEPETIQKEVLEKTVELYKSLIKEVPTLTEYISILKNNLNQLNQLVLPDRYIFWAMHVIEKIQEEIDLNNIDLVYSTSGPYSDHVVGCYFKNKFNKPWVCDFRDEWSNNSYFDYNEDEIMFKIIKSMEETFVQTADLILTTTPLATENYRSIFSLPMDKVVTITNGYDELDFSKIVKKVKMNEKFTIVHNGMLYMIRTPRTFLVALASLIEKGAIDKGKVQVQFSFTENREQWLSESRQLGLEECVTFSDYIEHSVSLQKASEATALLLIVGPGEKNKSMYPGKIFEYLRLGKPIISLSPIGGVVDTLIQQTKRGYNVDFDDIRGIEQSILQLYKKWEKGRLEDLPISEDIRSYERKQLTEKLAEQFDKAIVISQDKDNEQIQLSLIREDIKKLINQGMISQAKYLISEYEKSFPITAEVYQMKGIIAFSENNYLDAENFFKLALRLYHFDVDTLFNLGYLYEIQEQYNRAVQNYNLALEYCDDELLKEELHSKIQFIQSNYTSLIVEERKKLAFFSIKDGDKFLIDIIKKLSDQYEVKKVIVEDIKQLESAMNWADICWFEWCDEIIAYASKLSLAREKKIICRIHRYEVLTDNPLKVQWENVDKLIVVTNHLIDMLQKSIPDIRSKVQIELIENGIDLNKYTFKVNKKGYNLAFIGTMNYRKNPFMMLQIMKKLVDIDNRYQLYIAGDFQDRLIQEYWKYQVENLNLQENIHFDGWQHNVNAWLENKHYILAPTIHESFGYFIAEGMAKGIKPIVHDFIGSHDIYSKNYLWNTMDEAVAMVLEEKYESEEYREYIEKHYSLEKQMHLTKSLLVDLVKK